LRNWNRDQSCEYQDGKKSNGNIDESLHELPGMDFKV